MILEVQDEGLGTSLATIILHVRSQSISLAMPGKACYENLSGLPAAQSWTLDRVRSTSATDVKLYLSKNRGRKRPKKEALDDWFTAIEPELVSRLVGLAQKQKEEEAERQEKQRQAAAKQVSVDMLKSVCFSAMEQVRRSEVISARAQKLSDERRDLETEVRRLATEALENSVVPVDVVNSMLTSYYGQASNVPLGLSEEVIELTKQRIENGESAWPQRFVL